MYCRNKADAFNDTTKIVIICVLTNVHESWPQQNDKKTCKISQIFLQTNSANNKECYFATKPVIANK